LIRTASKYDADALAGLAANLALISVGGATTLQAGVCPIVVSRTWRLRRIDSSAKSTVNSSRGSLKTCHFRLLLDVKFKSKSHRLDKWLPVRPNSSQKRAISNDCRLRLARWRKGWRIYRRQTNLPGGGKHWRRLAELQPKDKVPQKTREGKGGTLASVVPLHAGLA